MTRMWADGLAITVAENKFGQPATFELCGRRYIVGRIEQQWETDTDWWTEHGRVWRRHYAVRTRGDSLFCVVYYDVLAKEWRLERMYD